MSDSQQQQIPLLDASSMQQHISMQDTVAVPIHDPLPSKQPAVYRTYKTRYIGLFAIVILNIATGFVWLTYSAVPAQSMSFLNCSGSVINLTSILYFIAYVLMAPISGWMCERHGIQRSLVFGAALQIIGSWIRFSGTLIDSTPQQPEGRLALTLIGQVIAAAAQPFFMNIPPKYAAVWFSERGRATATMIGSVSNSVAAALAQLVIPAITTDAESVKRTVLICAVISVIALFPALFISERPPTPPSPSAAEALLKTKEEPFFVSLKKALTNPQFLLMMLVFGTFTACFSSFTALIAQFTAPYGYTSSEAGYFGAAMIFSGLIGACISAPLLDKFKHFNGFSKIMVVISSCMFIALNFAIRRNFFGGLLAISIVLGISGFSVLPAGLEYGVEITYPVTPASSTSLLWGFGQLLTVIFLSILGVLQNDELSATRGINPPMIFIAVWAVVFGVVPMFMIKTQYLRAEAEEAMRTREKCSQQQQQELTQLREC
ncbi:MAG: major facilitator superfamily domain-containing protein [Linnemannia gamsii]|nr:MAG: major facilitator superfamily domain-containing protein [Linnemannia gamsii]